MAFPPSFIDELVARNPIEEVVGQYVHLKRSGANMFGLCPFHGEKTASFSVAPDKGIYYCFGCHKGGGAINFMMELEGLSYPDAVRFLANRCGMEVPEDGSVVQRKYLDCKFTMDERIVDGFYYAAFFKHFRRIISRPEVLDNPPEEVLSDID